MPDKLYYLVAKNHASAKNWAIENQITAEWMYLNSVGAAREAKGIVAIATDFREHPEAKEMMNVLAYRCQLGQISWWDAR